jgi:hypothetical protein
MLLCVLYVIVSWKQKERVAVAELLEQQAYCGNKRVQNSASALDRRELSGQFTPRATVRFEIREFFSTGGYQSRPAVQIFVGRTSGLPVQRPLASSMAAP